MLIALLALVLNGPVPVGAANRPGSPAAACGAGACPGSSCADGDGDRTEARQLDPIQAADCAAGTRRCHSGRPVTVPVAAAPRLPAFEPGDSGDAGAGPEPAPWPCALVQAPRQLGPAAAPGGGTALTTLPEAFPGVLARICVLRI
jgi:hypothetical protein